MLKNWAYLNYMSLLKIHLFNVFESLWSGLLTVFRGLLFSDLTFAQQFAAYYFVYHYSRWLYFEMLYLVIWKTSLVQPQALQKCFYKRLLHLMIITHVLSAAGKGANLSRIKFEIPVRVLSFSRMPTGHVTD